LDSFEIIAVKGGHVEYCVQEFNMTTLHCSDRGWSISKPSDRSIYRFSLYKTCMLHLLCGTL